VSDDVLFCTAEFAQRAGDRVREVVPGIELVALRDGEAVAAGDVDRITLAFFSHDAWPEHAADFMTVALQAPRLEWFHTMSAGVDHPVFGMILDKGAHLTTSSGSSAPPIAATVMMYLLALSRDLPAVLRSQAQREWHWAPFRELAGRTIAIIGWGPIGQEVARLAAAFGMDPTIVRRAARGDEPHPVRPLAELHSIADEHDVVIVAVPLTDDTRGMFDAAVFERIGQQGLFVNVGRGELVDQPALTAALVEGRLGGAAVDVTDPEPLPADDPLWGAPNVIITPHNSGSTDGTGRRAEDMFFANLDRWGRGVALLNEVPHPSGER